MAASTTMNEKIKKYLLSVARGAITARLGVEHDELSMPSGKEAQILNEKRGVFVTLEIDGGLRGCIGHIEGVLPLVLGVRENAESAAFNDPRFDPLTVGEFENVDLEISVLSVPVSLEYDDAEDLKSRLRVGVDGVVLSKGFAKATYLPQVWETFQKEFGGEDKERPSADMLKEKFLSSLCAKAGLMPDEWKKGSSTDEAGVAIETYQAEVL